VSIFLSKSFLQPILKSIPDFFVSMNIIEDFMLNTHTFIIYVSFRKVVFVHLIAPKLTWVNLLTWTLLKILMLIFWLHICQFFFTKNNISPFWAPMRLLHNKLYIYKHLHSNDENSSNRLNIDGLTEYHFLGKTLWWSNYGKKNKLNLLHCKYIH
jgi:hypothetical protein